jgi:hypothetical protein
MQEDQRTVGSTLNAISGGLSFRTGSIHLRGSVSTTYFEVFSLLLRRESIPAIGRLSKESLFNKRFQNAHAFVTADLKQSCSLVDRWREAAHFDELTSDAIGDIDTQRGLARRRHRERFEPNVCERRWEVRRFRCAHGHKTSPCGVNVSTIRPKTGDVKVD